MNFNFNTKILNYVVTVAEERNFTNAAKRLYVSQPSLSQSIIHLEQTIGATLFDRSVTPLNLTEAGQLFVEKATNILSEERELEEQLNDMTKRGPSGILIGISSFRNATIIPSVLPIFRQLHPGITIKINEELNDSVQDMLTRGVVDLAFLTDTSSHDLVYEKVYTDRALLVLGRDHPLCQNYQLVDGDYPVIDFSALCDESFTLLPRNAHIRKISEEIFDNNRFYPSNIIETTIMDMAHRLAAINVSAAIIQQSLLTLYQPQQLGCYFRFPDQDYLTDVYICYRKNFRLTNLMKHFIGITQEVLSTKNVPPLVTSPR